MAMSGALTQLGVRGPQDCMFLAPNDLTFWKASYPRHTNFAMTELEIPYESNAGFGRKHISAKLRRSGDLLNQVYKYDRIDPITYTNGAGPAVNQYNFGNQQYAWYVDALGHAMLEELEIQIGNHQFDKHTGEYLEIQSALADAPERLLGEQIGKFGDVGALVFASQNTQHLFTPFRFWFNKFHEQSLPMIGLYWHDVNIYMDQRRLDQLFQYHALAYPADFTVPADPSESHLLGNYVYLDKPERAAFASGKHEYLFDQVQFLGEDTHLNTTSVQNHSIRFNHPTQEIIWVCQRDYLVEGGPEQIPGAQEGNNWFEYQGVPWNEALPAGPGVQMHDTDAFDTATIMLNNHERTIEHRAHYYRLVQPWERHSRIQAANRWIYTYSFALRPEHLLDTGSCNFSRMDNAVLRITYPTDVNRRWTGRVRVYARNKNLAKNCIGMMGIKFAA